MSTCSNLPDIIDRKNFDKFKEFFDAVCEIFKNNVIGKQFKGRKILLQHPKNNQTIWHIVSKENPINNKRNFDRSRAERITWISHLLYSISCSKCKDYLIWAKKHNGKRVRWLIFCKKEKYVIVLEEYGVNTLYLITAYNVTAQKEHIFLKEYNFYNKNGIK